MKYTTRITRITVGPEGEALFHRGMTHIEIEDDSGGEFVVIRQQEDSDAKQQIAINPGEEWVALRDAIDQMMKECRG
jgi:hypothetical protein